LVRNTLTLWALVIFCPLWIYLFGRLAPYLLVLGGLIGIAWLTTTIRNRWK
jgi:hypothetical protein